METLTMSNPVKKEQKINLIDGDFTANEASHIINSILKVKINFHKLHRLSITEGNQNDPCVMDNSRIEALYNEQENAALFFKDARLHGKKLKINSTIQITLES